MDLFSRIATLLLFLLWRSYWWVTEQKADKEKPKLLPQPAFFSKQRLGRNIFFCIIIPLIVLPLLGVKILPMEQNVLLQSFGFLLVVLGIGLSMIARRELGTNWANAYEYQIKKKQVLVTTGIYSYIRNPIYTGLIAATTGAGLVGQSYLFLLFMALTISVYIQSKKEERILEEHFGNEYREYKKRTKMLIPFIF